MDTQEVTTRVKAVKVKSEGHKKDGTAWAIYDVDTDDGHFGILFDIPRGVLAMKLQGQMAKIQYHIEIGDKTNPKTGEPYKNKVVDSLESAGDVPPTTAVPPAVPAAPGEDKVQFSMYTCVAAKKDSCDTPQKAFDYGKELYELHMKYFNDKKPLNEKELGEAGLTKIGEVDLGSDIPF